MSVQGSYEWLIERLGHVTASRFADVMTQPQSKADREAGKLSKTAESYMVQLIGEHLTQEPAEEIKSKAIEWGERWEPVAREAYAEYVRPMQVEQVGFCKHPRELFIGCSPDSVVSDDGLNEIKCPLTAAKHVNVLLTNEVPSEHWAQIQGGLWVTGRQWCDFVSYHDKFHPDLRLAVVRIHRDDEFIERLAPTVVTFRDHMLGRLHEILLFWQSKVA